MQVPVPVAGSGAVAVAPQQRRVPLTGAVPVCVHAVELAGTEEQLENPTTIWQPAFCSRIKITV